MKTLNKIFVILFLATITFGCGDDDTPTSTNKFTINGTDFETPNASLFFEDGPPFQNKFMLAFGDGKIIEAQGNGGAIATTATNAVAIFINASGTDVPLEQNVLNSSAATTTYAIDKSDSTALTNILSFTKMFNSGGIQYGDPDLATKYILEMNGNGTLTINSITLDFIARNGTINCSYTMVDDNGVTINGAYTGNFNIYNGF